MKTQTFPIAIKRGSVAVKIYRCETKGYQEFVVCHHDGERRRRQKFADLGEARREAESIATKLCRGELDVLTLANEDRAVYVRACQAVQPFATALDLAAIEYAEARKRLGGAPLLEAVDFFTRHCPRNLPKKTVREVLNELLMAKEGDGCSAVYLKDLGFRLGRFAETFHCNIGSVRLGDVNEFLRSMKCAGRSRNNYRMAVIGLFKFAEASGYLAKGLMDFNAIAKAKECHHEIQVFTPKEISALLKAAVEFREDKSPGVNRRYTEASGLIAYLALGAFAGLRTAEIQRQAWQDINLDRGYIRVTAAKGNTAQKRLVPILPNLKKWLLLCWQKEGGCCSYRNLTEAVYRITDRASVTWKHNALRHSFISYRVAETASIPQVALEAGNSVAMVNRHYRELVTAEEAKAWFAVEPMTNGKVIPMATGEDSGKVCPESVPKNASNSASR